MDNIIRDSLNKYFNNLQYTGYQSISNTNKLLFLTCIQELIDAGIINYVSEEDYEYIIKALYCVYGSNCLIAYPESNIQNNMFFISKKKTDDYSKRIAVIEETLSRLASTKVIQAARPEEEDDSES